MLILMVFGVFAHSMTCEDVQCSANISALDMDNKADLRAQLEGLEVVQTPSTVEEGIQVRMYTGYAKEWGIKSL